MDTEETRAKMGLVSIVALTRLLIVGPKSWLWMAWLTRVTRSRPGEIGEDATPYGVLIAIDTLLLYVVVRRGLAYARRAIDASHNAYILLLRIATIN
jgi:hypothetical protein